MRSLGIQKKNFIVIDKSRQILENKLIEHFGLGLKQVLIEGIIFLYNLSHRQKFLSF